MTEHEKSFVWHIYIFSLFILCNISTRNMKTRDLMLQWNMGLSLKAGQPIIFFERCDRAKSILSDCIFKDFPELQSFVSSMEYRYDCFGYTLKI